MNRSITDSIEDAASVLHSFFYFFHFQRQSILVPLFWIGAIFLFIPIRSVLSRPDFFTRVRYAGRIEEKDHAKTPENSQ